MTSKVMFGCAAVSLWIVVFSAGLLVDSKPYRDRLRAPTGTAVASTVAIPLPVSEPSAEVGAFAVAICLFTPLNVAILTLLAGFIGGCASNLTYSREHPAAAAGAAVPEARDLFRTESPFASTLRSFLVYLGFIAGVFITTNNPFENATPDQYVRFAGTVSLLAFVVGYDPTKFQDLLHIVPRPGTKGV